MVVDEQMSKTNTVFVIICDPTFQSVSVITKTPGAKCRSNMELSCRPASDPIPPCITPNFLSTNSAQAVNSNDLLGFLRYQVDHPRAEKCYPPDAHISAQMTSSPSRPPFIVSALLFSSGAGVTREILSLKGSLIYWSFEPQQGRADAVGLRPGSFQSVAVTILPYLITLFCFV